MVFSIVHRVSTTTFAAGLFGVAVVFPGAATAEPGQDDQFLKLLDEAQIPAIASIPMVIVGAHQVCDELAGGMPVGDVMDAIRTNAFDSDPDERQYPPDRIARTITRFMAAAVKTYCPGEEGKLASTAAHHAFDTVISHSPVDEIHQSATGSRANTLTLSTSGVTYRLGAWRTTTCSVGEQQNASFSRRLETAGYQLPVGQINPPNPPQIPVPPPAARVPEQPPAAAQQPGPPQRAKPPPQQVQPEPPQQPPIPPQEVEPPGAAPQPGGAPGSGGGGISGGSDGGGSANSGGGGSAPAEPAPVTPAPQPAMPPGVVRLAP